MTKRLLCQYHFNNDAFCNPILKNRLKSTAVPIPFEQSSIGQTTSNTSPHEMNVLNPEKTYGKKNPGAITKVQENILPDEKGCSSSESEAWVQSLVNLPSSPAKQSKNSTITICDNAVVISQQKLLLEKLQQQVQQKNKKLSLQSSHIAKLRKAVRKIKHFQKVDSELMSRKFFKKWSKTIVRMQIRKKRQWFPDEKKFALILHYKSPNAYKYLTRMISLPSESTVRHWIGKSNFLPGINNNLFNQIKVKSQTMEALERKCVITFDEMCIKQFLEYNKYLDIIEGFEDYGHLGRTKKFAKHALVFMARGIFSSWKLPVAYYFSSAGVPSEKLKDILYSLLEASFKSGLKPQMVICDQGAYNQKLYKLLRVNKDKPYFEFNGRKVFAVYDTLHLIKSFRNNLLNGQYLYGGNYISFTDIKKVYELDKGKTCRALVKLTDKHIYPSTFQRMNVKLATQVLSHSVASAIRTCIETGQLNTNSARHTADFIGNFYNKFKVFHIILWFHFTILIK